MMTQTHQENESFISFLDQLYTTLNHESGYKQMREKAWQRFLELKLPTRHHEAYQYIKLKQLFAESYQILSEKSLDAEIIEKFLHPECSQSTLVIVNGKYAPHLSRIENLPGKLEIMPLQEAYETYGALLNNHWSKAIQEEVDAFVALNNALHQEGLFIYFPPNTVVETPIHILHVIDHATATVIFPRLQVFVGARSEVKFMSTQQCLSTGNVFVNHVGEFILEENAHVQYDHAIDKPLSNLWHFEAFRAFLKKESTFKTACFTQGSASIRHDYRVQLNGENAEALVNNAWMLNGKNEAHSHVFIDHQAPNCRSYQLFKGVLTDFSRSSFEGKIMVRQKAQKTEAFQLNNNLIMNDYAHADSKPNLEIFADDVKASHGATIGQLDKEQLFYLKTRGFSDAQAKNLLIYGFSEQVIEMFAVDSFKQHLSHIAKNYLTKE